MRIVVGSGALAAAVVGGAIVLGQAAAPPSSAGVKAVKVSSDEGPESGPSGPPLERMVVYGHSMPAGGGASAASQGYPALAAEELGVKLVNHADGGSGSTHAAVTLGRARPADARDAVVLHTGLNDIFRRGEAAVDRGRQAVRRFLAGTTGAGRRVIFTECQPGWWLHTPAERNLQPAYDAWNDMIREEAATAPRVDVIDICEIWDPRRFASFPDFHPNDEGHARMAAELVAVLSRS